jgi:AraC-like DNA-binding protein
MQNYRSIGSLLRNSWQFSPAYHSHSRTSMYDHVRLFARAAAVLANDPSLSLRQLARHLRVHPHTLAHIIRERTGAGFSAWRARHRLVAARILFVSRPDLSIKEIAAATGFGSTAVFDRFIRRTCGCSPSQCRTEPPFSRSLSAPPTDDASSADPSARDCARPDGSGVNVLDRSSTDCSTQDHEVSGTLESCTASS